MILPTIYLGSNVLADSLSTLIEDFQTTGPHPSPLALFYEESALAEAQLLVGELEPLCPGIHLSQMGNLGRSKAFREIAFKMNSGRHPWLFIEPGLIRFHQENWYNLLCEEYRVRLFESRAVDCVLAAQGKDKEGEISPLGAVFPARLYDLSSLVRFPGKNLEQDLRWEIRNMLRLASNISMSEETPIQAFIAA